MKTYKIEEIVYLKTDLEVVPRMITKYEVSKQGRHYCLASGTSTSWHSDFEFTRNRDELNKQIGFRNDANTKGSK